MYDARRPKVGASFADNLYATDADQIVPAEIAKMLSSVQDVISDRTKYIACAIVIVCARNERRYHRTLSSRRFHVVRCPRVHPDDETMIFIICLVVLENTLNTHR